jgi:hypothetical protein
MEASDLINAAIDELHGSAALSTILLKVKSIAFLLKNQQLKDWVNFELNGYKEESDLPPYRKVFVPPHGTLLHTFYSRNGARQDNVLLAIENIPEPQRTWIGENCLTMNIIEIEDWASSKQGGEVEISNTMRSYMYQVLYKERRSEWVLYRAWQKLPAPIFKGILLTIRATLLDLLLDLSEFDSISLQSLQQKQAISDTVNKALHSINAGPGSIVNVSHGERAVQATNTGANAQQNIASGESVSQNIGTNSTASLDELLKQLAHFIVIDEAFAANRPEMEQQLDSIKVQLQKPEPKKGIIKRAFESLTELAADSAGTMAGHAIFEVLHKAPELLSAAGLG